MRISAKGRYALAAAVSMAGHGDSGECITVISISEELGISKIYLEQVFSLLKRGGIVSSVKGAQGGYMLARPPREISAYQVLLAVENALMEKTEETAAQKAPAIDAALRSLVFLPLDDAVRAALETVSLDDLAQESRRHSADSLMYFI